MEIENLAKKFLLRQVNTKWGLGWVTGYYYGDFDLNGEKSPSLIVGLKNCNGWIGLIPNDIIIGGKSFYSYWYITEKELFENLVELQELKR